MKTTFSFTFQLFLLILLTSYSTFALAIDCKKAKSEIEKLICKPNNDKDAASIFANEDLILLDNEFNNLYNKIISGLDGEKKEEFKKSIQDMIKVRDMCVNVYGFLNSKKARKILQPKYNNEDTDQEYTNDMTKKNLFDKTEYQKGCLETFYNSIINSMKDLENFKIPSIQEYLDIFFAIRKFNNLEDDTGMSHGSWNALKESYNCVYERFLFFKNHPFVIDRSSHWYYDPRPYSGGNVFYYTFNKDNKDIELVGHVGIGRDPRPYGTSDIVKINGSFYIPNDESFSGVFNMPFIYRYSVYCNTGPDTFEDCVLQLKNLEGVSDSLFAFTEDHLTRYYYKSDGYYGGFEPLTDYQKDYQKCLLGIVKKYSEKTINLELVDPSSSEGKKIKYIVVKSQNVKAIEKELRSKCHLRD